MVRRSCNVKTTILVLIRCGLISSTVFGEYITKKFILWTLSIERATFCSNCAVLPGISRNDHVLIGLRGTVRISVSLQPGLIGTKNTSRFDSVMVTVNGPKHSHCEINNKVG